MTRRSAARINSRSGRTIPYARANRLRGAKSPIRSASGGAPGAATNAPRAPRIKMTANQAKKKAATKVPVPETLVAKDVVIAHERLGPSTIPGKKVRNKFLGPSKV